MPEFVIERAVVGIRKVKNHPRNYRHGDVGAISQSIEAHGQFRPLLVQKSTGYVLAGNHTLKALRALHRSEVVVDFIECTDEQALRILAADNRASSLASNDDHRLAEILQELAETETGLDGTLFTGDDLDELLRDVAGSAPDALDEEGDLDTGTVPNARVSQRNALQWISMRSFRANKRKAALRALKAAKDAADPRWIEQIADEVAAFAKGVFEIADRTTVVAAPPARDSAFKGTPHFATEIAKGVALRTGFGFADIWQPTPADRKGHHPRREKDPPTLKGRPPKRVLLVDDVATSGATIEACAAALREAGSSVTVIVWVYNSIESEESES